MDTGHTSDHALHGFRPLEPCIFGLAYLSVSILLLTRTNNIEGHFAACFAVCVLLCPGNRSLAVSRRIWPSWPRGRSRDPLRTVSIAVCDVWLSACSIVKRTHSITSTTLTG